MSSRADNAGDSYAVCECGAELEAIPVYVHKGDGSQWFQRLQYQDELEAKTAAKFMDINGYNCLVVHEGTHVPGPKHA